jgi:adenylate cyclase
MGDGRTRREQRVSLVVVPVHDRIDLVGEVEGVFAGLATWLAVSRAQPTMVRSPADLRRVGAAAGVRYVLRGWTESERDRLRLTVELNEAESGRVLWSDRADRPLTEREGLRADIGVRIGRTVPQVLLRRELDRAAVEQPAELTAQDLALRAFAAIMRPRRGRFEAAAEMLEEAQVRGGFLAGTRFSVVWWHLMAMSQGWGGDPGLAGGIAAGLDQDDPAAIALSAHVAAMLGNDYRPASRILDRVLDGAPLCGIAGSLKALTLCWLDDAQGAMAYAEQASAMPALGPERAWRDSVTALVHYVAGQYVDAARWARISATHYPGLAANLRVLACSLVMLGRLDEAQQAADQVLVIDPGFRIGVWRARSLLPERFRDGMAQRLRLAGLPG